MDWNRVRRGFGTRLATPVARFLAWARVSPNALTIVGFLLNAGVGVVLGYGYLFLGGFLVLAAGAFDMLDGAVARLQGKATVFGALLDSTLDRFSEAALLAGLLVNYLHAGARQEVYLVYAGIVGSLLVSYVKARAEGLGLKCESGLLQRPERVVLLAAGLLLVPVWDRTPLVMLWMLAVLTNATALQRMVEVWRQGKAK